MAEHSYKIDPEQAAEALRAFLLWFDKQYPEGGKATPGLTLFGMAEQARAALTQPAPPDPVRVKSAVATIRERLALMGHPDNPFGLNDIVNEIGVVCEAAAMHLHD